MKRKWENIKQEERTKKVYGKCLISKEESV